MDAMHWLMAANAALWIGLGAYLFFLIGKQRALEARLTQWTANGAPEDDDE